MSQQDGKQEEDLPSDGRRWHVCCSETDPEFIRFCAQLAVSASVLALSIFQLARGSTDALYPSLLTLVLGVYVPTPGHGKIVG